MIKITIGPYIVKAKLEETKSPKTCEAFKKMMLPYKSKIIHARWSGESCWIPMGEYKLGVGFEEATSFPSPGEILFYPGGYSETEILFPYGSTCFASKMGQLAGSHFLTVVEGKELLPEIGKKILWEGAMDILFEETE
ncbi:MAG TPA: DUF3830 family protein [Patescibacteria group bacterium]|nr:DUF3830 family protein [Patescibacteria group bacterium]